MFQSMIEKQLMDFVEKADLNHDKIPDKKQLEPIVSKLAAAVQDGISAVNWTAVMAALDTLESEGKVVAEYLQPFIAEVGQKKTVDIGKLVAALSDPTGGKAMASILLAIHRLSGVIDHAQLKKSVQEAVEAKTQLDAFLKPLKKK